MAHIRKYTSRFDVGDNDRDEVVAYCGYREECSGSGRHSLRNITNESPLDLLEDCPLCVAEIMLLDEGV